MSLRGAQQRGNLSMPLDCYANFAMTWFSLLFQLLPILQCVNIHTA